MNFLKSIKWRKYLLIASIVLMITGVLYCSIVTNYDVNIQRVTIPEDYVKNANYFSSDRPNGSISCLLITPENDPAPSSLRPAIIWLHGWTVNKYIHINYARELARAGMVVLMTDHPGHGESGGIHDFGLSEIAGARTALDWLIDVANSTYNLRINGSNIGMTGHSLGGIATANTAAIDPRVKAAVSIYTWGNMTQTIIDVIGESPYSDSWVRDILLLTNYYQMVGTIDDANARSPITVVNLSTPAPNNWLLITGESDQLTSTRRQCEVMAAACGQKDNTSYIDMIESAVNADEIWEFPSGNLSDGTARKLYIPSGLEHGSEGIADEPLYMQMRWFGDAFNWDVESYYFGAGKSNQAWHRLISFGTFFLGLAISIFPMISYLSRWRLDSRASKSELIPNMPKKDKQKLLMIYPLIYILASAPALLWVQLFGIESFIPFFFTDLIIIVMLMKLVTLTPALAGTITFERRKYKITLANIGLCKKNAIRSLFTGTIGALVFIGIFNLCDYFMFMPLLYPSSSPSMGIWGFILVFLILLGATLVDELFFRGLAVSKMQSRGNKLVYLVSIGYGAITTGLSTTIIFTLYLGIQAILSSLLLMVLVFGIGMIMGVITGIFNTYIFQRTGNVLGGVVFSTLVLGFFVTGHFGLLGLVVA